MTKMPHALILSQTALPTQAEHRPIAAMALKVVEVSFIAFFVITLPLWFPLLAIYVLIDPPYRMAAWFGGGKRAGEKWTKQA